MLEIQIILQNFLQTVNVMSDYWWKSDINNVPKWKPIRDLPHQHFVKIL